MIVSIVGGHGSIARLLTRRLVATGTTVRGLVRDEAQFDDLRDDGAEPVLCDLEAASDADLDAALAASDVVVFAAGAGPDSGPERKNNLDRDGAIKSVQAATRVGADRFMIISSMGADDPPDDDETFSVYLRAKAAADEAARAATIDATIIRPGALTDDDPTGKVSIAESTGEARYRAPMSRPCSRPSSPPTPSATRHSSWSADTHPSPKQSTPTTDPTSRIVGFDLAGSARVAHAVGMVGLSRDGG